MRVVVIGAGAGGLCTALLVARAGHRVVVVERDDLAPPPDLESAAAGAFRPTAPQIVQPHILLSTCRDLLRERLPDVYKGMLDAGVAEASLVSQMPPGITDRAPAPGDERFMLMMTRRATVDWVLARAAAIEPGVEIRYGSHVVGLLAEPGDPPRVHGVRTADGALPADLVIDASGRRSPLDRWLVAAGARPTDLAQAECGLAYYGRQYRARPDDLPGPVTTRVVAGLNEFVIGLWGGDNATMQIALAPLATDRRFIPARDPAVFSAVVRSVPFYAAWLDGLDPITDVYVMGGLHNTLRRLVVDGCPVATGLHAVGDVVCTTNPTFARGLSLAMRTATDLVDILAAHPDDPYAQALAMDGAVAEHIAPWYADQATNDAAWVAMMRRSVDGGPAPDLTPPRDRIVFGQLRAAAQTDAVAFRALWRIMGMVGQPADVYGDPAIVERVRAALAGGPPPSMPQPSRAELERALSPAPVA